MITGKYLFTAILLMFCCVFICQAQMSSTVIGEEPWQRLRMVAENEQSQGIIDLRGKQNVLQKKTKRVSPVYTTYLNVWYKCGVTEIGRPSSASAELDQLTGKLPEIGHVTNPNMKGPPRTETARHSIQSGIRSRMLNPHWQDGMLAYDCHDGREFARRLENLVGWEGRYE